MVTGVINVFVLMMIITEVHWTLDWTMDWTMDWTLDWNMDSILDSFSLNVLGAVLGLGTAAGRPPRQLSITKCLNFKHLVISMHLVLIK